MKPGVIRRLHRRGVIAAEGIGKVENINGDTAMGAMLKFGSEGAKQYYEKYVMDPRFGQAHMDGDIHIHDMDFYTLLDGWLIKDKPPAADQQH